LEAGSHLLELVEMVALPENRQAEGKGRHSGLT
jgi:hypothetical protein